MATSNSLVQARKDVRSLLASDAFVEQLKQAVPQQVNPQVLVRVATTTIQKTPNLLQCTRDSLLGAVIECAQLGLMPDGILGEAYLVPYNDNRGGVKRAQLQIGYRGLIKLARNSGQVSYVVAEPVYECDQFEVSYAPDRTIKHVPDLENETRGESLRGEFIPAGFRGAYALVKYKTGEIDFEYLPLHRIEQIRRSSKAGEKKDAPWMSHWVEMARKSAIRALAKRLPLSPEFMKAANLDDYHEQGIDTGSRANLSDTVMGELAQDTVQNLANKYASGGVIEGDPQQRAENEESPAPEAHTQHAEGSENPPPAPSEAQHSDKEEGQTSLGAEFDPFGSAEANGFEPEPSQDRRSGR